MKAINTPDAPQAIGTYSQAMSCGNTVYLSGQIPISPATMALCSDEIQAQVVQVFENLKTVCLAAGGSLSHIAKLTVYLTDLKNFSCINEIMARYFSEPYPARAVVQVSALPKGSQVEIDGVMVFNN